MVFEVMVDKPKLEMSAVRVPKVEISYVMEKIFVATRKWNQAPPRDPGRARPPPAVRGSIIGIGVCEGIAKHRILDGHPRRR